LVLLLATVLYLFFGTYRFYVYAENVNVAGTSLLTKGEVSQASEVDGYSIFWINPGEVRERVEKLPYVKQAHVQVWLPNRVQIHIEEREPVAAWRLGADVFWVDEEGVRLSPRGPATDLVTIVDAEGKATDADGRMRIDLLHAALTLHSLLPGVSVFNYSASMGLHFTTPDGTEVVMGAEGNLGEKVMVFEKLREQYTGRPAPRKIDLRFERAPYVQE